MALDAKMELMPLVFYLSPDRNDALSTMGSWWWRESRYSRDICGAACLYLILSWIRLDALLGVDLCESDLTVRMRGSLGD